MKTLAIETSSRKGSAALVDADGSLIAEASWESGRGTSPEPLHEFIGACARRAPLPALIVAGLGPGSYSGTRIGIASALGAGMAWRARVVGLPSVLGYEASDGPMRIIGDARRDTAYHAVVHNGHCTRGPELLEKFHLLEMLDAERSNSLPVAAHDLPPWWSGPPCTLLFPSAVLLARAALLPDAHLKDGTRGLEPLYLRPPTITQPKPII